MARQIQGRPGKRRNLGEMVFDSLVNSIKSGAYEADERLPT